MNNNSWYKNNTLRENSRIDWAWNYLQKIAMTVYRRLKGYDISSGEDIKGKDLNELRKFEPELVAEYEKALKNYERLKTKSLTEYSKEKPKKDKTYQSATFN